MSTVADCANHLFLSERRFRELLDQGVIDRQPPSTYDEDLVREQYITHLREIAAGRSSKEGDLDLTEERARLAKEQADAQEMKNAVSRGELLARQDVTAAITASFARVRARLLAMPSKLAPSVIGVPTLAAIKKKISDAVKEALEELASTVVVGVPASDDSGGDD